MIPHFTEIEKIVNYPAVKAAYLKYQAVHEGHVGGTSFGLFGAAWLQHLFFSLPADRSLTFAPLQSGALQSIQYRIGWNLFKQHSKIYNNGKT